MGHRSQCWFLSLLTESGAYTNQNGNSESVRLNLGHAAPIAMYLLGRNHLKQLGLDLGKERERVPHKHGCVLKWGYPQIAGFTIINHQFWGTHILGNLHLLVHHMLLTPSASRFR